jgi:hypothetical protein
MLAHLADALGKMSMRNFARVGSDTPLAVSIGLSSAHFHAAGNRSFAQLLYGSDYMPAPSDRVATNPFLQAGESEHDIWSKANPEEDFVREQAATEGEDLLAHRVELDEQTQAAIEEYGPNPPPERHFPVYEVQMANASPGGYCLDWTADLPGDIKTGDIVSVKEEEHGDWVIAVIRWVSKLEDSRTLLGLELLSPRAMPYGAQIHQKTGKKSEPQRVLLLPEIKLVGQPHTLITPRAGFRERQKITLIREGERFYIQLLRQIAATGSYAQFDFRYIKKLGDVMAEDKSGPLNTSYDSVWSNI